MLALLRLLPHFGVISHALSVLAQQRLGIQTCFVTAVPGLYHFYMRPLGHADVQLCNVGVKRILLLRHGGDGVFYRDSGVCFSSDLSSISHALLRVVAFRSIVAILFVLGRCCHY